MGTMATVRINTTQGMVLYHGCTIQEDGTGWVALDDDYHEVVAQGRTLFECIDAVSNWHDNRAEAAWCEQQERLMESGGRDESTYRREMIAAGRGHLVGAA